ncbi:lysosomal protective protein-like [Physella acuta]|uniref:lysosomal protective protein-like n=1 Tax=Physella acuta TaxID=109671 RepID=UPI0027DDA18F|nr:lysosomal protective protein-like [Physella acuta]XP_059175155.1 lysosomal protective protein-like [Physella acuta]XP_059175156.1 lysosomal protective protein-like [Physella acuta]
MAVTLALCLAALSAVTVVLSAPSEDLITDLPGLTWKPNFEQYSGYLNGVGTKRLHYWFVQSSSNPKTDPVVLWMNGGPGCSSLHGFLTEHGPFRAQPDGESLLPNPFAWNQVANMIYLEAPAGVGFSYSQDRNYSTDDDDVARNNHLALQDFFKKFPEYSSNDFYISGESYGGIYVPTLASLVLDDHSIKLKGFVVGNGLSDDNMNDNSIVYFAYFHGLIGDEDWNNIYTSCCSGNTSKGYCDFVAGSAKSSKCASELSQVQILVWSSGLNVYNLYADCAGGVRDLMLHYDEDRNKFVTSNFGWLFMFLKNKNYEKLSEIPLSKLESTPPCVNDSYVVKYLNSAPVKSALHISNDAGDWDVCSSIVGAGYQRNYNTMGPQYQKAISRKMRILVYNGDVDMACNFLGDEWFVDSLHVSNPQERRKWYYKAQDGTKQVGGFVKVFDRVAFLTVRGAGHMVPTDRPRQALEMFVNYIQNTPF